MNSTLQEWLDKGVQPGQLTLKEAAELCHLDPATIRRAPSLSRTAVLRQNGKVHYYTVDLEDLAKWYDDNYAPKSM